MPQNNNRLKNKIILESFIRFLKLKTKIKAATLINKIIKQINSIKTLSLDIQPSQNNNLTSKTVVLISKPMFIKN